MSKKLVQCPKCKKKFFTSKKKIAQCRGERKACGHRFSVKEHELLA